MSLQRKGYGTEGQARSANLGRRSQPDGEISGGERGMFIRTSHAIKCGQKMTSTEPGDFDLISLRLVVDVIKMDSHNNWAKVSI